MDTQEAKMSRLRWRRGSRAPGKSLTSETDSVAPFYLVLWLLVRLRHKPVLPQISCAHESPGKM